MATGSFSTLPTKPVSRMYLDVFAFEVVPLRSPECDFVVRIDSNNEASVK